MSRPLSAEDPSCAATPSYRSPPTRLSPLGPQPIGTATRRAGHVRHPDVATAARHLGLALAVGTPRGAADPGQRHAPPQPQAHHAPPSLPRVNLLDTSRAPNSSVAMSPTPFPRPPRALAQRPPPAEGRAVTASPRDGRGTGDGGPRDQQVRKRWPPQLAQVGYSTETPNAMGNRTGPRRAQPPGIYTVWRARRPAVLPPPVPSAAH